MANPVYLKDYIFPTNFLSNSQITIIELGLEFDPKKVSVPEEFDLVLYDDKSKELARLDPFLGVFQAKQRISLKTTLLEQSITNDHSILTYIPPTDINMWNNHGCSDYNGISFQDQNGEELAFDVEDYNSIDRNAWFWVKYTNTFNKNEDQNIYILFDGPCSIDYSDYGLAYPSDYNMVFHLNGSGNILNDATKKYNGVISGADRWRENYKIDGGYSFASNEDANVSIGGPRGQDFTIIAVIKENLGTGNSEIAEWSGFRILRRSNLTCADKINFEDTGGNPLCSNLNININQWFWIGARYTTADHNRAIYVNGGFPNSSTTGSIDIGTSVKNFYIGVYSDIPGASRFAGDMSEITYFNRALSHEEMQLLYLSMFQANNFVTIHELEMPTQAPDLNFTSFYEYDKIKGGSAIPITFIVQDSDSNNVYIDLNYSSGITEGTGTVILSNEEISSFSCDSNNLSIGSNCTYLWNVPLSDGNFYLLAKTKDIEGNQDFNHSNSNFLIDSTDPILSNQEPLLPLNKDSFPFDYNIQISDSGAGPLNCIARIYYNSLAQYDLNTDVNNGYCYVSLIPDIYCGDKVKVGFYGADSVYNISEETLTNDINYNCLIPPPVLPKEEYSRYFAESDPRQNILNPEKFVNSESLKISGNLETIAQLGAVVIIATIILIVALILRGRS